MLVDHLVVTARPVRLALVGIGDAGAHHLRALRALGGTGQVELVAVCSRDAARAQARLVELGFPATVQHFAALPDLLDSGVAQAAILATPDGLHAAQITACVRAGLHVLVEKPLALHPAEAAHAVAAARQAGTVLRVGYHLRHHAAHTQVQAQAEALLGRLHGMSLRWAWPDPATTGWRARGDGARFWSLAALGTHAIDLCQWIAGSPVAACRGLTIPPLNEGVDRGAEVSLRFGSGLLAHISVSVTHRALSRMLLVGERGELECLGTFGARGTGEVWLRPLGKPAEAIPFTPHDPYAAQLGAFVSAVRARSVPGGRPPLIADSEDPGLADALKNVELLDSLAALPGSAPVENLHAKPREN